MQLLRLRIKNLNSLKGEHGIDFCNGPLAETGLFAITGPTGAGKSTILDAITLALYNQTPRNGTVSTNSISQLGSIITRNTDEAWAQLDFQIKEEVYRSQWGISRNRNGKLRDYTLVLAKQKEDGKFKPLGLKKGEVPKENANLIGLNFDQFLRSILLSQGDFARFLKSNPNERGELLEKITGTEIYRTIGQRAFYRQKEEWVKLEKLKQQLEGIELLPDEERSRLVEEQERLSVDNKALDTHLLELNTQLKVLREGKELEQNITAKKAQLVQMQADQTQFDPDKKRLTIHQQLLPLKADVLGVQHLEQSINNNRKEEEEHIKQVGSLTLQADKLKTELEKGHKSYQLLLEKEAELTPILKAVREQDSQIKITQSQSDKLRRDNLAIGKEIESADASLKQQEQALSLKEKVVKALQAYFESNKVLNHLSEQLPALKLRSSNLQSSQKLFKGKVLEMSESHTKRALLDATDWLEQQQIIEVALAKSEDYLLSQVPALKIRIEDKEATQKHKDKLEADARFLEETVEQLKRLSGTKEELTQLNTALDERTKSKAIRKDELEKLKQAIELNHKYLEEYQLKRERELLEAKYEDARKLLKPDVECPLCGSKDHPYVDHYEKKGSETERLLLKHTDSQGKLDNDKMELVKLTSMLETEILNLSKRSKELKADELAMTDAIEALLKKLELDVALRDIEVVSNRMYPVQEEVLNIDKQLKLLDNIETARTRNKEFKALSAELKLISTARHELNLELAEYKSWVNSTVVDKQISELDELSSSFKVKQKQLQSDEEELSKLQTIWKEKGNQLKQRIVDYAKQKQECDAVELKLGLERENRKDLFGEALPDEVLEKLLDDKGKQADGLKSTELRISQITTTIGSLNTRVNDLGLLIKKDANRLEKNAEQLISQLSNFSISSMKEALQCLLSDAEFKLLQNKNEQLITRRVELKQSLKEEELRHEKISAAYCKIEQTETELAAIIEEKGEQLKRQLGKVGSVKEKLAQDERNKLKQADKVKVITAQEKEFNKWQALSGLIGDAQGNKFAKFAQELTLQQVMVLANGHLKRLTDRYLLKHVKTESLDDLFVVDTYHGNAERSVKTLSGGESFLVSLSLALGLSDLAGQNTVIGSLFIDEGFGTLDQNTLDVALSALEKLQNETKRTIGIISHVPALKERVTTQIELTKNATGYSTLAVKT